MFSCYCPPRTFVSLAAWNVNKKGGLGQRPVRGFVAHSLINERKGVKARSSLERVYRLTTLNQHARKIYLPQTWDKLQPRILSKQISWMQHSIANEAENLFNRWWDLRCLSFNTHHHSTFQTGEMPLVILSTIIFMTKSGPGYFYADS